MELRDRLQLLRKRHGYSQEQLADRLGIARQTVSKWENGQATPEIGALISLSMLYGVSIDRLVKGETACGASLPPRAQRDTDELIRFLILAKQNTYAAKRNEAEASRVCSRDFCYEDGSGYAYRDSYLGGERFIGEEAVWLHDRPVWGMNYAGRVLDDSFCGAFLKAALMAVTQAHPYRGPQIYARGEYRYHCVAEGAIDWFHGYEEIFCADKKVYECRFHGGLVV